MCNHVPVGHPNGCLSHVSHSGKVLHRNGVLKNHGWQFVRKYRAQWQGAALQQGPAAVKAQVCGKVLHCNEVLQQ